LAAHLLAQATSPSGALIRAELQRKLQEVLEKLRPLDREVLVLRHFEQLSNQETALALNIDPSAASTRYIRALQRLKQALEQIPGFFDEWTGRKSGGAPGGRVGRSRSLPGHGTQEAGGDG
jgi:RNA polymerase sigma-70 factor (ECF subfamily)